MVFHISKSEVLFKLKKELEDNKLYEYIFKYDVDENPLFTIREIWEIANE